MFNPISTMAIPFNMSRQPGQKVPFSRTLNIVFQWSSKSFHIALCLINKCSIDIYVLSLLHLIYSWRDIHFPASKAFINLNLVQYQTRIDISEPKGLLWMLVTTRETRRRYNLTVYTTRDKTCFCILKYLLTLNYLLFLSNISVSCSCTICLQ